MALRILLADDSMTAQNMGKKILTDAGYDVVTVSNGAAAVKKIAEVTPDVAILDVYMPGYNGLEVCERVKLSPATAHTPVLLSVGKMEPFRPEDGMKVKADGVIIKPFEATDLVTVVERLASRVAPKQGTPVAAAVAAAASAGASAIAKPTPQVEVADSIPAFVEEVAPVPTLPDTDSSGIAPALQTFEPADDPIDVLDEPHLESHSLSPVGAVEAVAPPELQTTAVQQPEATSVRQVMTEAALMDGYNFGAPVQEAEPRIDDVLSDDDREFLSITSRTDAAPLAITETEDPATGVAADVLHSDAESESVATHSALLESNSAAPTWHAEEEDLTEDDLALDLETVMQRSDVSAEGDAAAAPESQPETQESDVISAVPDHAGTHTEEALGSMDESGDDVFDPFKDLSSAGDVAPVPSVASPMLAPIGKTSFDELDAIMEQAASRFDEPTTTPATSAMQPEPEDILLTDEVESRPQSSLVEPGLMLEEVPELPEVASAQMHSSDALSGVFDLDPPAAMQLQTEVQETPVEAAPAALEIESFTEAEAAAGPMEETPAEANVVQQRSSEAMTAPDILEAEPPAEAPIEVAPDLKVAGPAGAAVELPVVELPEVPANRAGDEDAGVPEPTEAAPVEVTEPAMVEHATELAVAAVTAEMQSVPEAASEGPVERVVERVVDRLRPMLTAMVEEIMKELKK